MTSSISRRAALKMAGASAATLAAWPAWAHEADMEDSEDDLTAAKIKPRQGAKGAGGPTRVVTDSAGRKVTVPQKIDRVFVAGDPASVMVYSLTPEKQLGWTLRISDKQKEFMPPEYANLAMLGRITMRGDTANKEVVLKADPDLIIDYGTINDRFTSLADRVQEQLKVPYLLLDGTFSNIPKVYRELGNILGAPERAEKLAAYAEKVLADVDAARAQVPVAKRPKVFYGRGRDGLETGLRGSIIVELLDRAGAINVADAAGEQGIATISLEKVLQWDPDIVLTIERNFYQNAKRDPRWGALRAIKEGRFYLAPDLPFSWFDHPPGINRLIGVRWLINVLYPQVPQTDLASAAREFYELFYHHKLTDKQVAELLSSAARKI